MQNILVNKLHPNAQLPSYGTAGAAGADLYACLSDPVMIAPGTSQWITTGLSLEIPAGYAGMIYARSGLSCRKGLAPANKVGVVDSDYRGEITVVLHNHGTEEQIIRHGDRIAQLVITPVFTPSFTLSSELSPTERGTGGFGSTGE
jgi:dUTP pyrophosphatase